MNQDDESTAKVIGRIFEHWRIRMGKPRARLDAKRSTKIRARLRDGYTEQDLIDAIEGCGLSKFHNGDNETHAVYNDIALICRDAEHVDRFIDIADKSKKLREQRAAEDRAKRDEAMRLERERRARIETRKNGSDVGKAGGLFPTVVSGSKFARGGSGGH